MIPRYAEIRKISTKEYGVYAKHMEKVYNLYSYGFRQCTYSQPLVEEQKKDQELYIHYKQTAETPEKGKHFILIKDTNVLYKEEK